MSLIRHLRFSLRTLLLAVTGISLWLGWEVRVVHERRAVRRLVSEIGGSITLMFPPCGFGAEEWESGPKEDVPWVRKLLGDEWLGGYVILVHADQLGDGRLDESRIRGEFPEAVVCCLEPFREP